MKRELTRRNAILAFMLAGVACTVGQASANDGPSRPPVNVDRQGAALRSYDPVSYFTEGKPLKGSPAFAATFSGATYYFVSGANKAAFVREPSRYAPQYGGYCAYAAAHGYRADADPLAWSVVAGKLYVNYNASVAKTWSTSAARFIRDGDSNWTRMKVDLPK